MMVWDPLVILLLTLSLAANQLPNQGPSATALIQEVTFADAPDRYPRSCSAEGALMTVEGFLAAFNAGEQGRSLTYFAEESSSSMSDGFRWFWIDGVEGIEPSFLATDLPNLSAHFAARHAQGEVMRLSRLHLQYPAHGVISFHYEAVRTAVDLGELGAVHIGKGAMRCADHRLIVWGMAQGKPAALGE